MRFIIQLIILNLFITSVAYSQCLDNTNIVPPCNGAANVTAGPCSGTQNFCVGDSVCIDPTVTGTIDSLIIIWGDGTPCQRYAGNNMPNIMKHFYQISPTDSCLPPNGILQYTVEVGIKQFCNGQYNLVGYVSFPFNIRMRPNAQFIIPNTACTNGTINLIKPPCPNSSNPYRVWNLGNGNTSTAANPFTPNPYTTPGTYNVTLTLGNSCDTVTYNRSICILSPPNPSFSLNPANSCTPFQFSTNNTSPSITVPWCQTSSWFWLVTPVNNICTQQQALQDTFYTANILNQNITIPGNYTVSLKESNQCGTATVQLPLVAKTKPQAVITPAPDGCLTVTFNPQISNINTCLGTTPTTYSWSFPGGSPTSSNVATPPAVSYAQNPNPYTYTVGITNECGTTTLSDNLLVLPSVVANAGPNDTICAGLPLDIGSVPQPGVSYTWSPATGLDSTSVAKPTLTLSNAGTYTYTVTASAGNCVDTDDVTVTILPQPAAPVVTGATICQGQNATLTAQGTGTIRWFASSTGGNPLFTGTNYTVNNVQSSTTYYVEVISPLGCSNPTRIPVNIIVNLPPVVTLPPSQTLCTQPQPIDLNSVFNLTGGVWSGANITPPNLLNAANPINPASYILFTVTDGNGCIGKDSVLVNVVNATPANAGPDIVICQASPTINLPGQPTGGTWSGSSFLTNGNQFITSNSGTYTLTYSVGNGTCLSTDQMNITINPLPTVNAGPDVGVCEVSPPFALIGQPANGSWSGNGVTGSTFTPNTNLLGPNTLTYSYTDANGCTNNDVAVITVNTSPTANFSAADSIACLGLPFQFTNQSVSATNYMWTFGDGGISTQQSPSHTYAQPGYYLVTLIASVGSCYDTITKQIRVLAAPLPAFSLSATSGCSPLTVNITNTNPNIYLGTYSWAFDNITPPTFTGANPPPLFYTNQLGLTQTNNIQLIVNTGYCPADTITQQVSVLSAPLLSLSANILNGCSPFTVTYSSALIGSATSISLNLGDGTVLTGPNATFTSLQHTYYTGTTPSTYYSYVTATNACGTDVDSVQITATPNNIFPSITVSSVTLGCAPATATFFNNTINANTYQWNFGDGVTLTTFDTLPVNHLYQTGGTFNVSMAATLNNTSCPNSPVTDTVYLTVNVYPQPSFLIFDSVAQCSKTVYFSTDKPQFSYFWDYGDGSPIDSTQMPVHTYQNSGNYIVTVIGFSPQNGCTDTTQVNVTIGSQPVASAIVPIEVCQNEVFQLQNTALFANKFYWFFGNGDIIQSFSPPYKYTDTGYYSLMLIAVDTLSGCRDTAYFSVNVVPEPIAGIYLIPVSVDDELDCEFKNISIGLSIQQQGLICYYTVKKVGSILPDTVFSYNCYDDFICSTLFLKYGTYQICQYLENINGCKANTCIEYIVPPVTNFFIPNAFTPNTDNLNDGFRPYILNSDLLNCYTFDIFDRWGVKLFHTNTYGVAWNGKNNSGTTLPDGVYVYRVHYCWNNQPSEDIKIGRVTLIH